MFQYKKLGKFTYHIIPNKRKIKEFLVKWIGKEWQIDHEEFPDQQWTIEWLRLLPKMNFELKKIRLEEIILREDLMKYKSKSYNFLNNLKIRADQMEEYLLQGSSISPLIVNKENMELMDGYTRFEILKRYQQKKAYFYLGLVENQEI
ncbi:MAG: hypothetical protein ACFE9Z_17455 [Promethearchaeota archaeon]